MTLTVVKIGGRALETPDAAEQLAQAAARMPGRVVFVHGGGSEVTDWSTRLGIETRFLEGLRVTDTATLPVVVAVLAGLANKRLVAQFRAAGLDAVGISGVDGGILEITPHPDHERLGAVGVVTSVRTSLLKALLSAGWTPVVAGIGALNGDLYNLNADEVARAIAAGLRVDDLILLSDAAALRIDGKTVPRVKAAEIAGFLEHPQVTDGMRPKLRSAEAALKAGVGRVHIAAWSGADTLERILNGRGDGTVLGSDAVRTAEVLNG